MLGLLPKKHAKLPFFSEAAFSVETAIKYEGYIANEQRRMLVIQKLDALVIPQAFDYRKLQGLSNESKLRLIKVRPETLGQASRISGIRPTDVALLGLTVGGGVSRETWWFRSPAGFSRLYFYSLGFLWVGFGLVRGAWA